MKWISRLIPLGLMLVSCRMDPAKTARIEQNFDMAQPGMTKEQVRELLGAPWSIRKGVDLPKLLKCNDCELWLYRAPEGSILWPHIAFEETTGKVTTTFHEEPDQYF